MCKYCIEMNSLQSMTTCQISELTVQCLH
uniref:Uncharacterized protein n=1 Tax=Anguilla anguilla TaxID=7936 RepID=A0A0E9UE10_ANGAN